jgi:hypothetical protein
VALAGVHVQEDQSIAVDDRVRASGNPFLEIPRLFCCVVSVSVDLELDGLAFGFGEVAGAQMNPIWEVEDGEVADAGDDDGDLYPRSAAASGCFSTIS